MSAESEQSELINPSPKPNPLPSISLNIWPPSQRTRDAVTTRLVETLTDPTSALIKRHGGAVPRDAAVSAAEEIEKAAFAAADSDEKSRSEEIEVGLQVLEAYSKEISKRMMEFVKGRKDNGESGESVENEAPAAA